MYLHDLTVVTLVERVDDGIYSSTVQARVEGDEVNLLTKLYVCNHTFVTETGLIGFTVGMGGEDRCIDGRQSDVLFLPRVLSDDADAVACPM